MWRGCGCVLLLLLLDVPARGESLSSQPPPEVVRERSGSGAVAQEIERWSADAAAVVAQPFHWDRGARLRAGLFTVGLAGLFAADHRIITDVQAHKTATTDRVVNATQGYGAGGALAVSGGYLAIGLLGHNPGLRDTGRDALETSAITAVLTEALKTAAGRERPRYSDEKTRFQPFHDRNASFPSGHATEAFGVASVVSAHAHGWLVPSLAWTLATTVAFDRMESNVHFASDVLTGAVLGASVGRFIVRRHATQPVADSAPYGVTWQVAPIQRGLEVSVSIPVRE